MTMRLRAILTVILALAILALAACDHYNCSSGPMLSGGCTAGTVGISGGGGTGGSSSIVTLAYYVNNNQIGSVELNSSAQLLDTPNFVLETLPDGYLNSAAVIAQEQFLFVPYSSTGAAAAIYGWTIDGSTGALTALTPLTVSDIVGLASASQLTTPIITDSTGSFLYLADARDNRIDVFQIDPTSGVPNLLFQTTTTIPPWNLALDGLGRFLYVTEGNESGEGVGMEVFSINSATGALFNETLMPTIKAMWQVQGEPIGNFMVGADGQTGLASAPLDPNVYVFSINSTSGALTQVGKYPTTSGFGPTRVVVHPTGKYVYDFSLSTSTGFDAPLDGFSLLNGVLTPLNLEANTGDSGLTPPDGGFFDQSGAYLFIHAGSSLGVYNIDSTTGIPSEPTQPVGVGSGAVIYPWAVTDPE
jgi:DNA-binding beta-propeller fold protein YncE